LSASRRPVRLHSMNDRNFSPETRRSIADMARKRGLSLVVLFGSVAANAARPDSDTDIAVKFVGGDPGLPRILEVQEEISGLFRGRNTPLSSDTLLPDQGGQVGIPRAQNRIERPRVRWVPQKHERHGSADFGIGNIFPNRHAKSVRPEIMGNIFPIRELSSNNINDLRRYISGMYIAKSMVGVKFSMENPQRCEEIRRVIEFSNQLF